jgi:CheY-like chemotaxis protein
VVDDDDDHRTTLGIALREAGHQVDEAEDGRGAIDYLLSNPEPGIILLDLIMPGMSGWDVLSVLRSYVRLRRIPVIVVTGNQGLVQVPGVDVVARLQKPYRFHELQALMRRHLPESDAH